MYIGDVVISRRELLLETQDTQSSKSYFEEDSDPSLSHIENPIFNSFLSDTEMFGDFLVQEDLSDDSLSFIDNNLVLDPLFQRVDTPEFYNTGEIKRWNPVSHRWELQAYSTI